METGTRELGFPVSWVAGTGVRSRRGQLAAVLDSELGPQIRLRGARPGPPFASLLHPVNAAVQSEEDRSRFGQLVESGRLSELLTTLKLLCPAITDLRTLATPSGEAFFAQVDKLLMPVGLLGGGFNQLLKFALNLEFNRGGYVGIDEVEAGFHYSLLPRLIEFLAEAAVRNSVLTVITTHSREVLEALALCGEHHLRAVSIVHLRRGADGESEAVCFNGEQAADALRAQVELR